MTKITSLELGEVYRDAVAAGGEVVEVRAVNTFGEPIKLPSDFQDSTSNVKGAKGFAWIANHSQDGAFIQVKVSVIAGPHKSALSGFIDPSEVASFVANGK